MEKKTICLPYATVCKTARKEELSVYLLLQNSIFKNKKVIIGDSLIPPKIKSNLIGNQFCDIYTEDKSIGVEVVSYESLENYAVFGALYGNLEAKVVEGEYLTYTTKPNLVCSAISQAITQGANNLSGLQNKIFQSREIKERLRAKLINLNGNSYSAFDEVNLALVSFGEPKDINAKNIANIYKNLKKEFPKHFCNLFVIMSNNVFKIDKSNNLTKINTYNNNDLIY